jgi:hypothetical protein
MSSQAHAIPPGHGQRRRAVPTIKSLQSRHIALLITQDQVRNKAGDLDVSRVWVRNPAGGWVTAFWKHLHRVPVPFGELAWDHVRGGLDSATEEELADAVAALLTRAHAGPARSGGDARARADRKVAARIRGCPPRPRRPAPRYRAGR